MSVYSDRIALLRSQMAQEGYDAWVVPSADPHLSEYLPPRWQARAWLSGFDGSAGTLVVTADFAGVWVDSRYWEQAGAQLHDSGIEMMKLSGEPGANHVAWLAATLPAGAVVGADGQVLSVAAARALDSALSKAGASLRTDCDLLATIWPQRPGLPEGEVYEHVLSYACVSRADKLARVRSAMQHHGATHHWISTLDDLAWVLNLRGSDVEYNPVFLGHLCIDAQGATVYVDDGKISTSLQNSLGQDGVQVLPYGQAPAALGALRDDAVVLIDPARCTQGVVDNLPASVRRVEAINPSTLFKSCKTSGEMAHVRTAMEHDGAALCEFFAWFDQAVSAGEVTELDVDTHLTAARARRPGYVSLSFGTIAAFNANGAMPHYRARPESFARIDGEGLLLIDSGGQYLGGTTDITRVVAVGRPSGAQRHDCTTVLKGMIALSRARFPVGTPGSALDALARGPIWAEGADYGHGTGHGVGYFLNVHEGPQSISYRAPASPHLAMLPGMITSNEPGIYRPGKWGVRIENLVHCVPSVQTELGEFLEFETLTLCPIDRRCLEVSALRDDEMDWLDAYHEQVRERVAPLLEGDALQWLIRNTGPLLRD